MGRDLNGSWNVGGQDLEEKIDEFARFMSEVAGTFTLAYLQSMPRRVEDRWLKSLFIHLLSDSISTPQNEESEIRAFPYILARSAARLTLRSKGLHSGGPLTKVGASRVEHSNPTVHELKVGYNHADGRDVQYAHAGP